MDMTIFFPRTYHKALAFIGKRDWLRTTPATKEVDGREHGGIILEPLPSEHEAMQAGIPQEDYKRTYLFLKALVEANQQSSVLWTYGISKAFADGPKIFLPTVDQCRALANVSVDLQLTDYQQPYPSMIYVFPRTYIMEIMREFNTDKTPKVVLSYHNSKEKYIAVGARFEDNTEIVGTFISDRTVLEESLKKKVMKKGIDDVVFKTREQMEEMGIEDDIRDFDLSERLERLSLNLGLVLAQYPVKVEPLNVKDFEKYSKMLDSKSPERRSLAQKFMVSEMQQVKLVQDIKFYEERYEDKTGAETVPSGRVMPSHWRKGHFRMYRQERGWKENKRVFIKPMRIHKEWNTNTSETQVIYRG